MVSLAIRFTDSTEIRTRSALARFENADRNRGALIRGRHRDEFTTRETKRDRERVKTPTIGIGHMSGGQRAVDARVRARDRGENGARFLLCGSMPPRGDTSILPSRLLSKESSFHRSLLGSLKKKEKKQASGTPTIGLLNRDVFAICQAEAKPHRGLDV